MITTVTTVTTVTVIAAGGISLLVSMAAVITLIAFLAVRELAGSGSSRFSALVARFTTVGILPLLMAFAVIIAVDIARILG